MAPWPGGPAYLDLSRIRPRGAHSAGGGGTKKGSQRTDSSSSIPGRAMPFHAVSRSPYRSRRRERMCRSRWVIASVSPRRARTARTTLSSVHRMNRCSPRTTSWTSTSRSVSASRAKFDTAAIIPPTTSRSLSVIRLRDMCFTRRPLGAMRKTSSSSGSSGRGSDGGAGAPRDGGDVEDGVEPRVQEEGAGPEEGERAEEPAELPEGREGGQADPRDRQDHGEDEPLAQPDEEDGEALLLGVGAGQGIVVVRQDRREVGRVVPDRGGRPEEAVRPRLLVGGG